MLGRLLLTRMRNTTFYHQWIGLAEDRRADFKVHVLSWAGETGSGWLAFLQVWAEAHAQDEAAFLVRWNHFCETHLPQLSPGRGFIPSSRPGQVRCDAAWLTRALRQLGDWLELHTALHHIRSSEFYLALAKRKRSWDTPELLEHLHATHPTKRKSLEKLLELAAEALRKADSTAPLRGLREWLQQAGGQPGLLAQLAMLNDSLTAFLDRHKLRSTRLCRLLELLEPGERADFLWWVARPRHREQGKDLVELATLVLDEVMAGKGLGKADLFKSWRPGEEFEEYGRHKLSKAIKALAAITEDYLAQAEGMRDGMDRSVSLLRALNRRGGECLFEELHAEAAAALERAQQRDETYYLSRYLLEECQLNYRIGTKERFKKNVYQDAMHFAGEYAVVMHTRMACDALAHKMVTGKDHDLGLLAELMACMPAAQLRLPLLARAFQKAWLMLAHPGDKSRLEDLLALLRTERDSLAHASLRRLYKFALNVCLEQINLSRLDYQDIMRQIFEDSLPSGVLLENGEIDASYLRNIIVANARNGNIEAAKRFYEEYKDKIAQRNDPCTPDYLAAMIRYYQQPQSPDYRDLIGIFQAIALTTNDAHYKIDSWAFRFRIAFENEDWAFFEAESDNFRMQLERSPAVKAKQIEKYHSFRLYTCRLAAIQSRLSLEAAKPYRQQAKVERQHQLQRLQALWGEVAPNAHTVAHEWLKSKIQAAMMLWGIPLPERGSA